MEIKQMWTRPPVARGKMTKEKFMKENHSQELELAPAVGQVPAVREPLNPMNQVASMLEAVINKGVTSENVTAMEQLVGLFERMQNKDAERQFNAAFVALQNDMPAIKATEPVPNNDGSIRYKFAPYEKIMEQVSPFLGKHGFTISFSTKYDDKRIVKICTLRHAAGHAVSNEFAVRIGQGPPKATETQADGAAGTYAKRQALCDALNIVVEKDVDARDLGACISKVEAEAFRRRVKETGSDALAFLKYAQAQLPAHPTPEQIDDAFYTIPESMLAILDNSLKKKESTK